MAYHHGNLRAALISAAAEILDESGAAGLSLRATAQLRRRDAFPGLAEAADRVFAVLSGPPAAGLTSAAHSASSSAGEVAGLSPRDPRALLWSVVHGLAHLLIDRQLTVDAPGVGEAEAFSLAVTEKLWFGLAPR